jgi:hypothetical protein
MARRGPEGANRVKYEEIHNSREEASEGFTVEAVPRQNWERVEINNMSLAKMLSGGNAFRISEIQEAETKAVLTRRSECNNVTLG